MVIGKGLGTAMANDPLLRWRLVELRLFFQAHAEKWQGEESDISIEVVEANLDSPLNPTLSALSFP